MNFSRDPKLREIRTVNAMIRLYCGSVHGRKKVCPDCNAITTYAEKRVEKCKFGADKPACQDCPVHCYSPDMRRRIKEIMRFSGPRMIWKHPVMATLHIMKHWRNRKINILKEEISIIKKTNSYGTEHF